MVTLYVEGGGDSKPQKGKDLITECRRGFRKFITNAGITVHGNDNLNIVPCGGRGSAYKSFCRAIKQGENAMLLVDSEKPVGPENQTGGDTSKWLPWNHLKQSDRWNRPKGSNDTDCHLMVQIMESWFLTDTDCLEEFFETGFNPEFLPAETDSIEDIRKVRVFDSLDQASQGSRKGTYKKGDHSFELLSRISPAKVTKRSPWACRFVDELKKKTAA